MKNVGEFLKYIRKLRGLTQDQVAERLNIATPVLSKWENDKAVPSLDMLCRLCNVLNVSIEECTAAKALDGERVLPPENYDAAKLGGTLKDLRIKNGLSQAEVGKKIFVTSQTVSKWESGGVSSLEILCKLADLFCVTPTQLLNRLECAPTIPVNQVTAEHSKKSKSFIVKIIAAILAVIIFLSAVAGLTVWLVLKNKNNDGEAGITQPAPPEEQPDPSEEQPEPPEEQPKPPEEQPDPSEEQPEPPEEQPKIQLVCPIKSYYAKQQGFQDPVTGLWGSVALYFEAAEGEEIYAAADGVITTCDTFKIIIDHGSYTSCYNNVAPQDVEGGSKVKAGQTIAKLDGRYLGFSLKINEETVEPLDYITTLPEPILRPHVHTWGEWKNNPTEHWQTCECGEQSTAEEHVFNGNICVCGYEKPTTPADADTDTGNKEFCLPVQAEIYRNYLEIYDRGSGPEEHKGLDFSAAAGDNVYAVTDGVIKRIFTSKNLDYCQIIIDHGDGIVSLYMGVKPAENISEGSNVKKGDIIGVISNDPYPSEDLDGEHLHFGMRCGSVIVNPLDYIPY